MSPNDLGKFDSLTDRLSRVNIDNYLKVVRHNLKDILIRTSLEVDGIEVEIQYSKTGFGGRRLWFSCPRCSRRVGILFKSESGHCGCRICLGLKYRVQRYKNMPETM